MSTKKNSQKLVHAADEKKRAFERLAPEREVLREEELVRINIDPAKAAAIVLDAIPKIMELLPEMQRLHRFDASMVAGLVDRARAVLFAASLGPRKRVRARAGRKELIARARELRASLLVQAKELRKWKVIDFELEGKISSGQRLGDIAKDLTWLADLLRTNWEVIEDRTPLTLHDLDEADQISDRMFGASSPVPKVDPNSDTRTRAFTLLVRSYEQVRREVVYLRWNEGDAERFAPTIYLGRRRRNPFPVVEESPPPPVVPPAPPTPAAPPVT
jgi:hypothetical protein